MQEGPRPAVFSNPQDLLSLPSNWRVGLGFTGRLCLAWCGGFFLVSLCFERAVDGGKGMEMTFSLVLPLDVGTEVPVSWTCCGPHRPS